MDAGGGRNRGTQVHCVGNAPSSTGASTATCSSVSDMVRESESVRRSRVLECVNLSARGRDAWVNRASLGGPDAMNECARRQSPAERRCQRGTDRMRPKRASLTPAGCWDSPNFRQLSEEQLSLSQTLNR
jgi:hypothetical protein